MSGPPQAIGRCCRLVELARVVDERGTLVVGETGAGLPFTARRFFLVVDAPDGAERGGHANRLTEELLVATTGVVTVEIEDGSGHHTVVLDRPTLGLHLAPLVWSTQHFGPGAALLVLASTRFDAADHIHDRTELARLRDLTPGRGGGSVEGASDPGVDATVDLEGSPAR